MQTNSCISKQLARRIQIFADVDAECHLQVSALVVAPLLLVASKQPQAVVQMLNIKQKQSKVAKTVPQAH